MLVYAPQYPMQGTMSGGCGCYVPSRARQRAADLMAGCVDDCGCDCGMAGCGCGRLGNPLAPWKKALLATGVFALTAGAALVMLRPAAAK